MRSSWLAHSEMVLQTLLCSEDEDERSFAVEKILELRRKEGDEDQGDSSVRPRRTPAVNTKASCLRELIEWTDIHEPPLTCEKSRDELLEYIKTPMPVPQWPCHGQSIERCVKQVTEAASKVNVIVI